MNDFLNRVNSLIQKRSIALLLLFLVAIVVFINILPNEFLVDDLDFIVHWELIKDVKNFHRFFVGYIPPEAQVGVYSPLRTVVFFLNYAMFQQNSIGWHVISIVIHLLGVWAIYCLTQLLMNKRWISFLTGLFFAVHPVHIESVTAVTGSIDTIGVVLGLWAFYWYIRSVLSDGGSVFNEHGQLPFRKSCDLNKKRYIGSIILAALAVFTHELMISLPLLMMMFDLLFVSSNVSWKRALKRSAPFVVIVLLYVVCKAMVLGDITRGSYIFGNMYLTLLVVIKAWAKYIGVLLLPLVLTHNKIISNGIMSFDEKDFDQAAFMGQSWHDPQVLLSLLLLLGIFVVGVLSYRKRPLVTFCVAWFFISLSPVSQIVPSAVYYAERYLYAGSWAYCLMVAWIISLLYQRIKNVMWQKVGLIILVLAIVLGYGTRTVIRNKDFRSWISLYEKAIRINPQSAYLKNDLGVLYMRQGLFKKSEKNFLAALEMQPQNEHFYFSLAETYAKSGQLDRAEETLQKAINIKNDFPDAYFNLAIVYYLKNNKNASQKALQQAVKLWKDEGKIFEAGESMEAFMIFVFDQEGLLKEASATDFLGGQLND